MQRLALNAFRDASVLRDYSSRVAHLQSAQQRRGRVRICLVDDEPFTAQRNLASYGFTVDQIGDIKSVEEVRPYHIVLCDILGVGKFFNERLQGAALISEIKATYPEKVVFAYTGAAGTVTAARSASERADRVIKKDIDIGDIVDILDDAAKDVLDPFVTWNKLRSRFVQMEVSTKQILLLEDAYVKSVQEFDPNLRSLLDAGKRPEVQQDVRAILQNLAASLVLSAVMPGAST